MRSTFVCLLGVVLVAVSYGQQNIMNTVPACQLPCKMHQVCRIYPQSCNKPPCPRKPTCIYPRNKPGFCPLTMIPFPGMIGQRCYLDYDCPNRMLCCGQRESRCTRPYMSSGACPRYPLTTKCTQRCNDDFDCPRGAICCNFGSCGGSICSWPETLLPAEMRNLNL